VDKLRNIRRRTALYCGAGENDIIIVCLINNERGPMLLLLLLHQVHA